MATETIQEEIEYTGPPPPPPPPSSATSPAHDFSFSTSLQASLHNNLKCNKTTTTVLNLASAGDILSHSFLTLHPPTRPAVAAACSSHISAENFSRRPLEHARSGRSFKCHLDDHHHHGHSCSENKEGTVRTKTLSFFFGRMKSQKKGGSGDKEEDKRKKKTKGLDMSWIISKTYASVMEIFKWEKETQHGLRRRPYSSLGHSSHKRKDGWWKKKGQLSAPVSMRTSPSNSGHLSLTLASSDESTVEELHSSIQAAIAHCKS